MKVTCIREGLLTACQLVGVAVAARTTKPILANVKAAARDDALTLMGTDLEVGIRYELRGVKVARAGSAILPVTRLVSILRETSDDEITLDAGDEMTTIRLSTGRFELPGGDVAERTAFAADKTESTRFAVTGVLWEAENKTVRLVATDTKRLALCEGPADVHGGSDPKGQSHLIPLKTIMLLERNLTDDGEMVRVALKPNEALFQTERALIHTRLVEGRFPPYRSIIPKKLDIRLQVPVADFLARVRQAAIMTDEESKRVDFHFEKGQVTLTARGPETGTGEVTLALPEYAGPVVDIAFDPAYLVEMLRAIEGEPTATLEMTDGQKPALFRVGDQYLYLVMPLVG